MCKTRQTVCVMSSGLQWTHCLLIAKQIGLEIAVIVLSSR